MANYLELLGLTAIGILLSLKILALWSRKRTAAFGLIDGRLATNQFSQNSVCSEGEGANIKPLVATGEMPWKQLPETIESLSGRIISENSNYLHATFRSRILGFEEDLEARYDHDAKVIHFRSASRVGYSDGGSNLARVETLKALLE